MKGSLSLPATKIALFRLGKGKKPINEIQGVFRKPIRSINFRGKHYPEEKKGIRPRHLTCGKAKTLRLVIQLLPFSLLCRNFGLCSFFGTFCRVFTACLSLLFCLLTKKPCLPLKNPDLFTQPSFFRDQSAKTKRAGNSP